MDLSKKNNPAFYQYSIITYSNSLQGLESWEKKLAKKNSAENSKIPVPKNSNFDRLRKVSRKLSKGKESNEVAFVKGQIISECPYEIIVSPKIPTKKIPRFLP